MSEAIRRKDPIIELPTKILLTSNGVNIFSKSSQKLDRVMNRRGQYREGLVANNYNALLIQKMILNSFAEEILVQEPSLLNYRKEITSTNNLILYAILYQKLSPSLAEMLFQSTVVKTFNRKNPKNAIVSLDSISKEKISRLMAEKQSLFKHIEDEIYQEVNDKINRHKLLSNEDKQIRVRSLDKFIAWIDKRIWYFYLIVYQTPLRREILHSFSSMIFVYLSRTQIATHLSNLLMEFIQNAEKAHFERIIVRNNYANRKMVDSFLRDRSNRESIMKEARNIGQLLELSWDMNSEYISVGHKYRVGITISNYGIISEDQRLTLSQKMKTDVDGISIGSFYEENEEGTLGAGLGLLYNSYLEDICRQEGIMYKCHIYPEPENEKTTVKLEIIF